VGDEASDLEPRVAATPETVKKMIGLDAEVAVEPGSAPNPAFSMPTMSRPAPQLPPRR
jgi:NAD/NADP transhydrogenase alpha subunit